MNEVTKDYLMANDFCLNLGEYSNFDCLTFFVKSIQTDAVNQDIFFYVCMILISVFH